MDSNSPPNRFQFIKKDTMKNLYYCIIVIYLFTIEIIADYLNSCKYNAQNIYQFLQFALRSCIDKVAKTDKLKKWFKRNHPERASEFYP